MENTDQEPLKILRREVATDSPFRSRMRAHQAWWRHKQGFGHGHDRSGELGSLLSDVDAQAGHNFLTKGIAELAGRSVSRHIEPRRLRSNLLSSQPMAFNLLGPLSLDPDLARRLLEPMLGEKLFVANVELEVTPEDKARHLNDETSFDALIRYVTASGHAGVIAVETKLSEPFSPVTAKTRADRDIYREVSRASGLFINADDPALAGTECWQMWRNHLLAVKFCENSCPPRTTIRSWVIRHQDDASGAKSVAAYRNCLAAPDEVFRDRTLLEVSELWHKHIPSPYRPWLDAFHERYVDLSGSEALFRERL